MTNEDYFKEKREHIRKIAPNREFKSVTTIKLESTISKLNEEIDTLNSQLNAKQNEVSELEDRLRIESRLNSNYCTDINELEKGINQLKDHIKNLEDNNKFLQNDKESLKGQVKEYEDKLFSFKFYLICIVGIIILISIAFKIITAIF